MYDSMNELVLPPCYLLFSLICVFIAYPIFGCAGKKSHLQQKTPTPAPLYVSKACNKKEGLCNDDPDLKSDKLLMVGKTETTKADEVKRSSNEKREDKSKASSGRKNEAPGGLKTGNARHSIIKDFGI
ncbi:hypothetical protein M3Y97_00165800 [Aphelenchoides bicaudatus]|nr:hypothetical protein M3Y97_00165800 [Aphelenchoides bicaudatus]